MKAKFLAGLVLATVTAVASAQNSGDPAVGKKKAVTCIGCHGVSGYRNAYPSYHVPKLGGQHAQYIVAALKAYKSGKREHVTMHAQASSLSEQDMKDIAAYFASQGGSE